MSNLRRNVIAWVWPAVLVIVGCLSLWPVTAEETMEEGDAPAVVAEDSATQESTADDTAADNEQPAQDPFELPDGSAAELLTFIEKVAAPTQQFDSGEELRDYLSQAAPAIAAASDKILEMEASDDQKVDAVHWKLESFRVRQQLGEQDAEAKADEFLDGLQDVSSPKLASAVQEIRLMRKLRRWRRLDASQRVQVVDDFVANMKAGEVNVNKSFLLYRFVDMLADSPDNGLATRMIDQLVPQLRDSDDPNVRELVPLIEGIGRRIKLPGNKIELEGTLLDGTPLDWDSYRGKVVLVDFWATDCGPCRAEVPNLIENYRLYHDKGFDVLGISLDNDRSQVEQYFEAAGIPWETLFQENPTDSDWDHPVANRYAINAIPRMVLVDQQGVVVNMNARGPMLGAELRRLLGEPAGDTQPPILSGAASSNSNPDDAEVREAPTAPPVAAPEAP